MGILEMLRRYNPLHAKYGYPSLIGIGIAVIVVGIIVQSDAVARVFELILGMIGLVGILGGSAIAIAGTIGYANERGWVNLPAGSGGVAGDETGEAQGSATSDEAGEAVPPTALEKRVRLNVGGIGASALGAIIMLCILAMPWALLVGSAEFGGESESESAGYTFLQASQVIEDGLGLEFAMPRVFFFILPAMALVTMASALLPRLVVVITCILAMPVMFFSYIYIAVGFAEAASDNFFGVNVSAGALPHIGFLFVGVSFLAIVVLQLIPAWNRRKS